MHCFCTVEGGEGGAICVHLCFFEILPSLREQSNDIKENSARDMHKNVETWGWWWGSTFPGLYPSIEE